jgi:hypothetical protein
MSVYYTTAQRSVAGFNFHFTDNSRATGLKLFVISLEKCCIVLFTTVGLKAFTDVVLFSEIYLKAGFYA